MMKLVSQLLLVLSAVFASQTFANGNVIKNTYWVEGEEGTVCQINWQDRTSHVGTGCNEGFICVTLRGRTPLCHRKCERIGDVIEGSCTNYKGPGHSVCMIEKSDEFRRAMPEGVKVCAIRCGGVPASPDCTIGGKCDGECPKNTKCGRVLEFDGPLRCA